MSYDAACVVSEITATNRAGGSVSHGIEGRGRGAVKRTGLP